MAFHLRKRDIAWVEKPTLIKGKALAGGFSRAKRENRCEKEKKTAEQESGLFHGVGSGVVASL
jgi:hypothetical protein